MIKHLRDWFDIKKPTAAQYGEWKDWEDNTRRDHPIGFWMTETLPDFLHDCVNFFVRPYRDARHYYRNRFRDRLHVLPTRLPKGKYFDLDDRLLHAIMESIVDYVAEVGMDHLDWEMTLDDTTCQPERAKEVVAIYKWWKEVRPQRPDAYDASGWSAYCDKFRGGDGLSMLDERIPRTPEDRADCRQLLQKCREIEEQYLKEDEDMLIRVMKIRPYLWT